MAKKKKGSKKSKSGKAQNPDKPNDPPKPDGRDPTLLAIIDSTDAPPGLGFSSLEAPPILDKAIPFPREMEEMFAKKPEIAGLRSTWNYVFRAARQVGYEEGVLDGRNAIRNNVKFWKTYDEQVANAVKKERERWETGGHGAHCASAVKGKNLGKGKAPVNKAHNDGEDDDDYNILDDIDIDELDPMVKNNPMLMDPDFLGALRDSIMNERASAQLQEREEWVAQGHGEHCLTKPQTETREVQTEPMEPPEKPKPRPVLPDVYSVPPTLEPLENFDWSEDVEDLPIIPLFPS